jgi:predicted N-acyltransferase
MAIHFEAFPSAEAIDRKLWNELAVDAGPTMEWEYFYSLEQSGAVSAGRGYRPRHLVAYRDGKAVALAPLYERDRAWVEFGDGGLIEFLTQLTGLPFDHGFVGTVPFTPIPGYQFLHHRDMDDVEAYKMLLDYIDFMCESKKLSSSRIYFVSLRSPRFHSALLEHGYFCLRGEYCLWFNHEYDSFEGYLRSFRSARRTKIKRELRTIRDQGVKIDMVQGDEAPGYFYDAMYKLYVNTWIKHMGTEIRPFLNQSFFRFMGERFAHRCSFSLASRSNKTIAMALFYHKARSIHGRYWGSFEEVPFLHFATCYYHPIMYAIQKGIEIIDPGFGGDHKLIRGYEVVPIYHYLKFYGKQQRKIANAIIERMQPVSSEARR